MVHALGKIYSLLIPGEYLIDIHPQAVPRPLTVQIDGMEYLICELTDENRFATYRMADEALETVVQNGLYSLEAMESFAFCVYFDTVSELKDYLMQKDSRVVEISHQLPEPEVFENIAQHLSLPGNHKQIVLYRPVCFRKFKTIPPG
jgi:hypothetical protein